MDILTALGNTVYTSLQYVFALYICESRRERRVNDASAVCKNNENRNMSMPTCDRILEKVCFENVTIPEMGKWMVRRADEGPK